MTASFSPPIDSSGCDREPIHIPGSIQPHGVLLVFDGGSGRLAGHAGPVDSIFGSDLPRMFDAIAGRPVTEVREGRPELIGAHAAGDRLFDLNVHRSGPWLIAELEPGEDPPGTALEVLSAAQQVAGRISASQTIEEACSTACDKVRALTGYDRVMAYRLDENSGAVVAESLDPSLSSFLHHRFPASDIPRQARELYLRNPVRVIPDVEYRPAPLVWIGAPPESPLDLSDSLLRSVSPVHIQYLRNMEVGASASISVIVDGRLWGLIACHHHGPRPIGSVERRLCTHIGQLLSGQIGARLRSRAQMEELRLARLRDETLFLVCGPESIGSMLPRHAAEVQRLAAADGAAIVSAGRVELTGATPSAEEVLSLVPRLSAAAENGIFRTHSLASIWPDTASMSAKASGILFCEVRKDPDLFLIWFRAEQVEEVNWAGNPHKPFADDPGAFLTPRRSFASWCETVRHQARNWTSAEVQSALSFRTALIDRFQQEELTELNGRLRKILSEREELLVQKDLLMREVHHRVQNSLQLVNAMLHLQGKEAEQPEVRTHFEMARQRLTAVAMVHRRLWRSDQIGDVRLDIPQ